MDGICLHLNFIKHTKQDPEPICCFGCSVPVAPEGHSTAKALLRTQAGERPQAQRPRQQQAGPSPGSSPLQMLLIPSVQSKGMSVGLHYLSF